MSKLSRSSAESQKSGGCIPEMKLERTCRAAGEAWKGPKQRPKLNSIAAKPLPERLHRGRFIVLHIKHGVELGDLQQIVDFLGQVQQLKFAALVFYRGVSAD